ncbi:MAG: HD domain-containing protein [Gammaproteobacteria bacterium]|nr:HD domain-containing protein [Gammaproteobacteria bacterium]MBV8307131.1 HD domain-containing protein [Gammaproteobacteria bacterium]MBV8404408.1 HD domain-containing protein [Gammaproteobacteria bacterium]
MSRVVSFRRMEDGTREDYLLLDESERRYAQGLADRVLESLRKLDHTLYGYPVTRLQHSLQAATRAQRAGADEELVVGALLHDIGDELAPYNHSEMAAAILRPYVRPEVTWIVEHHGLFQNYYYVHHFGGDRHARERLRGHHWYEACVHFCAAWDQCSFDPDYESDSLESFEPLLRRILARTPHDPRYQTPLA